MPASKSDTFLDFVIDQLSDIEGLRPKPMFGAHGLYSGTLFFGIINNQRLYLRTNEVTSQEYERYGMKPFKPMKDKRPMRYHEVPAEILDNREALLDWARIAIAVVKKG
jgi:DNA transformation protein and related proteins